MLVVVVVVLVAAAAESVSESAGVDAAAATVVAVEVAAAVAVFVVTFAQRRALPLGFLCGVLAGFTVFSLVHQHLQTLLSGLHVRHQTQDPVWREWERDWRAPQEDEDWGRINCTAPQMRNADDYYNLIDRHQLHCEKPVMVGGQLLPDRTYFSGEKWMCMDDRFRVEPGRCVVLSFGIGEDFSFDDDLDKRFQCNVHAFDPTIRKPTHRRSPNVMFYDIGIASYDRLHTKPKMARYMTILKLLQLENTTIDYLKLDVEGFENHFFRDVIRHAPNLLKNVKQIGVEVHVDRDASIMRQKMWAYFGYLKCYGFKVMFSEINPVTKLRFSLRNHERSCCYEVVWARERQW
ncbi:hypothetical protein O3P69_003467 [Scylla paramamosain]|uniref:Methyltransferase domain-containing protein n=1 Tax=Scylla paramamosain TaxID=85552 RepID=A0AAW0UL46_SCYPA